MAVNDPEILVTKNGQPYKKIKMDFPNFKCTVCNKLSCKGLLDSCNGSGSWTWEIVFL